MMLFKRLFRRRETPAAEPMHGAPALQTEAEQQATREHMLAEMDADRERRGAAATGQGSEPPADEGAGESAAEDA